MGRQKDKMNKQRRKSLRSVGVAIIISFFLVPMLFILLYIRSDQLGDSDAGDGNAGAVALGDNAEPDDSDSLLQPDENSPLNAEEHEETEPVIEIIGVAYLTFDDGPSRAITPGILDILAEEDIKATFFMMPYSGADDIFMRVINEGHEIGNHSYSHDYPALYNGSVGAFRDDVLKARSFVYDNFGYTTSTFRFPGGSQDQSREIRNPRIEAVREIGYRYFDWDVDSNDWRRGRTPEEVIKDVLENTHGKEHVIILLHDTYERTLEALPGIIKGLRLQGYEFDILKNHPG